MGHDITAISDYDKYHKFWNNPKLNFEQRKRIDNFKKNIEVAYLRRSAGSDSIRTFYIYLNCSDCDGGVSGNGNTRIITIEELKNSLEKFEQNKNLFETLDLQKDYKDYTTFIHDCLKFCTQKNKSFIVIQFS